MEYVVLFFFLLEIVYFAWCINFFRKEPGLKRHEKAYWIFLGLLFPLFSLPIYRFTRRMERRALHNGGRRPNAF